MITREQINSVSSALNGIPKMVDTCQQVVAALLETDQSWSRANWILSSLFATDYDRSRNRIVYTCSRASRQLKKLRRATISPEAIRAIAYVNDVRRCCQNCPQINLENIKAGKKFHCQVKGKLGKDTQGSFRFRLNEKGQILESQ